MSEGARYIDLDADRKLAVATMTRALAIAAQHLANQHGASVEEWGIGLSRVARDQAEKLSPDQIDQVMRQLDQAEDEERAIAILIDPPTNPEANKPEV